MSSISSDSAYTRPFCLLGPPLIRTTCLWLESFANWTQSPCSRPCHDTYKAGFSHRHSRIPAWMGNPPCRRTAKALPLMVPGEHGAVWFPFAKSLSTSYSGRMRWKIPLTWQLVVILTSEGERKDGDVTNCRKDLMCKGLTDQFGRTP